MNHAHTPICAHTCALTCVHVCTTHTHTCVWTLCTGVCTPPVNTHGPAAARVGLQGARGIWACAGELGQGCEALPSRRQPCGARGPGVALPVVGVSWPAGGRGEYSGNSGGREGRSGKERGVSERTLLGDELDVGEARGGVLRAESCTLLGGSTPGVAPGPGGRGGRLCSREGGRQVPVEREHQAQCTGCGEAGARVLGAWRPPRRQRGKRRPPVLALASSGFQGLGPLPPGPPAAASPTSPRPTSASPHPSISSKDGSSLLT